MLTTPACSSADTGVGASITASIQPWNGVCADLSSTPRSHEDRGHVKRGRQAAAVSHEVVDDIDPQRAELSADEHDRRHEARVGEPGQQELLVRHDDRLPAHAKEREQLVEADIGREPRQHEHREVIRRDQHDRRSDRQQERACKAIELCAAPRGTIANSGRRSRRASTPARTSRSTPGRAGRRRSGPSPSRSCAGRSRGAPVADGARRRGTSTPAARVVTNTATVKMRARWREIRNAATTRLAGASEARNWGTSDSSSPLPIAQTS